MSRQIIEDVACTQCGCVCDDLSITVENDRIVQADRACDLAAPFYAAQGTQTSEAEIDGHTVSLDDAISRAAEILAESRAPLIYGLSRSSTDGQRAAVSLADRIGATIDTTASLCHAPSIMAFQETGESTSSLGEVRNRCDLVVFWGSDPMTTHPRHAERYSVDPVGEFLPRGRLDRTVIVIDRERTASAEMADLFVQVDPERDFEALWTLRYLVSGRPMPSSVGTGASPDALVDLARRMMHCRSGVIFFGLGLSGQELGHLNVVALLTLVRELNAHTRFYARRMRVYGDVTGADNVLCWQTGYPFSVNLARGYPRFNPGEFSVEGVLGRHEADAALIIGSETLSLLSSAALEHLRRIPIVMLDYPHVTSIVAPTVRFASAVYGVNCPGTAYRMDEIPIPLKGFLPSHYKRDDEILAQIQQRLA